MSLKSNLLRYYLVFLLFAVVVNVVAFGLRRYVPKPQISSSVKREILDDAPGCPLDCGIHGTCQFRRKSKGVRIPACQCDTDWATFPERECGFETASSVDIRGDFNVTVSRCKTYSGDILTNPNGPCSVKRVGMADVACAAWLGGAVGADWFLMMDVRGKGGADIRITDEDGGNERELYYNGGYGAAGFFAILTGDYAGIGWLVNAPRSLIARESSIPFWDAYGFLHADTIRDKLING